MAKGEDRFERRYERNREEKERHRKNLPGADDPALPPPVEPIRNDADAPGRNDPCPCGSGRKYKRCCGKAE